MRDDAQVVETNAVMFSETSRRLGDAARRLGLKSPVFRSPPRIVGVTRTIRHRQDDGVVVAVAYRGRPWPAVVADMVEGVALANGLEGVEAARARDELWVAAESQLQAAA